MREEKEEEKKQDGTCKTLEGLKRGEVSTSREAPHWGEPSWDRRRDSFSVGREHGNQREGQSEAGTQSTDPCPAHPA